MTMINTFSNRIGQNRLIGPGGFHYRLLEIIDQILKTHNIKYYNDLRWLGNISPECRNFGSQQTDESQLVIIPTIDNEEYKDLINFGRYSKRTVLFLTAMHNFELDFPNCPKNVSILHWCHDMMFQMNEYRNLRPQKEKNPDMSTFWISLTHGPRTHRVLTAAYLLGRNLGLAPGLGPETGLLRISPWTTLEHQTWQDYSKVAKRIVPHNLDQSRQKILQEGFVKLQQCRNGGQPLGDPYTGHTESCDNARNFRESLHSMYHNSLIEIVNETTFFNKAIFLTEKFLNSVYGYNLPIVLSNQGAVEYLRQHGFDMFDDVIDHSYDTIADPLLRICTAIDSNFELLSNRDLAWAAWNKCQSRLDNNYLHARDHMYDMFADEFKTNFTNRLKELQLI